MNLFVDDSRKAPQGYIAASSYQRAITLMSHITFDIISLDYELNERYNGLDLITYMAAHRIYPRQLNIHAGMGHAATMIDTAKRLMPATVTVTRHLYQALEPKI